MKVHLRSLMKMACLIISFLGISTQLHAQTVDSTIMLDPAFYARHLFYTEVEFTDGEDNGTFDAVMALTTDTLTGWGDAATTLVFYTDAIKLLNDGAFVADNTIVPVNGGVYKIWTMVDLMRSTFNAYVQSEEMDEPVKLCYSDAPLLLGVTELYYMNFYHNNWGQNDYFTLLDQKEETNSDATLKELTTNIGTLSPEFSPLETVYVLDVPYGTTSFDIKAIEKGLGASVEIYDINDPNLWYDQSATIPFGGDGVDLGIIVTAIDGTEKVYELSVYTAEGASDATLSSIEVSEGAIDPVFVYNKYEYTVMLPAGTESVELTGIPSYEGASIEGNGTVTLTNGTATQTITVTSVDGENTESYTVHFETTDGTNYAMYLPGEVGSKSNINISGLPLTELPFTMEMWFKPDGNQTYEVAMFFNNPSYTGLKYSASWQGYQRLTFLTLEGDRWGTTTMTDQIAPDIWHHVAIVQTENTRNVYLDGKLYQEVSTYSTIDFESGTTYIGWETTDDALAFKGYVDEVRVWTDSLSAETIKENQYKVLNGDEENLLAYYNFDLPNTTQAVDASNLHRHGLISGGTYTESFPRVDLDLSSLTITPSDTLVDAFDPKTTEYIVYLPLGTTSINIDATTSGDGVTVKGTGNMEITDYEGTFAVTVESIDEMYSKEYTVTYRVQTPLTLTHSYTFDNGLATDIVGGADGTVHGGHIKEGTYIADSLGSYISLPADEIAINEYAAFTFEIYIASDQYNESSNNTMLISAGARDPWYDWYGWHYTYVATRGVFSNSTSADGWLPYNWETQASGGINVDSDGGYHHIVATMNTDSMVIYVDGVMASSGPLPSYNSIWGIATERFDLCNSVYGGDPTWLGSILEFNIYSGIMTSDDVMDRIQAFPSTEDTTHDATLETILMPTDTLKGFVSTTLDYTVQIAEGSEIPTLNPIVKVEGATTEVTAATTVPGTSTIVVTAKDGSTQVTYNVTFRYVPTEEELADATLSDLMVDGMTVTDFDAATETYTVALSSTELPVVTAMATNPYASVSISDVTSLPGSATVTVTSEDGSSTMTYTITFEVTTALGNVTSTNIKVYPTSTNGSFTVETNGNSSKISVYSLSGKMVLQRTSSVSKQSITLEKAGMYIMVVESEGSIDTFKVFKTK